MGCVIQLNSPALLTFLLSSHNVLVELWSNWFFVLDRIKRQQLHHALACTGTWTTKVGITYKELRSLNEALDLVVIQCNSSTTTIADYIISFYFISIHPSQRTRSGDREVTTTSAWPHFSSYLQILHQRVGFSRSRLTAYFLVPCG